MVSAVSVSALKAGIGSSIGIGLKCGIGTSLVYTQAQRLNKAEDLCHLTAVELTFISRLLTQSFANFIWISDLI